MKTSFLAIILMFTNVVLAQDTALEQSIERGQELYNDFCVNCHMHEGEGVLSTFPPLANSDFLLKNRTKSIASVKNGLQGEITVNGITYNSAMPAPGLDDDEIADVMNFILNSFGNTNDKMVTVEEVEEVD